MKGWPARSVAVLVLLALVVPAAAALEAAYPKEGEVVRTGTPLIVLNHVGDLQGVTFTLDGFEDEEGITVHPSNITYQVPAVLALREGNHTFTATAGAETLTVTFTVNLTVPPAAKEPLDMRKVVLVAASCLGLAAAAGVGLYTWARKTRRFTFRKHFLRHPQQLKFIVLYIPSGLAALGTLGTLLAVASMAEPPRYAFEYVLVAGGILALGPFGLSSSRTSRRTRAYERVFAQFLFELADAVRGGIDPVKAVQELAKGQDGMLRKPVKRASDLLRLGRPMDEALRAMTVGMGSPLVSRYASLVGEASAMGGSVAGVMQRAAKDMDDLVKIKAERRRALRQPVFTMYMAFGVLTLMVLQVVGFAPNIGDLNIGSLTGGAGATPAVPRMELATMQSHFFHLLLLNAMGGGLLVGSFTEGRIRNGILHAIAMTAVACAVYPLSV